MLLKFKALLELLVLHLESVKAPVLTRIFTAIERTTSALICSVQIEQWQQKWVIPFN